uniref:Uncharacterized protein n=1 Tax=Peronospora matthiolae TaxID=2874970 RepID=A0AAV1T0N6_9STRA
MDKCRRGIRGRVQYVQIVWAAVSLFRRKQVSLLRIRMRTGKPAFCNRQNQQLGRGGDEWVCWSPIEHLRKVIYVTEQYRGLTLHLKKRRCRKRLILGHHGVCVPTW